MKTNKWSEGNSVKVKKKRLSRQQDLQRMSVTVQNKIKRRGGMFLKL